MIEIIKKALRKLGVHLLYQFLHETVFTLPRVFVEETRLTVQMLSMRKHRSDNEVILASLRTEAHVLDKGLLVDYWMHGRGKGIYSECVRLLNLLKDSPLTSDPSYQWAREKVLEYEKAQKLKRSSVSAYEPIHCDQPTRELLHGIIKSRRSIRSFLEHKIEMDVLEDLVGVVNWAPVSCNCQPVVLHITQNPAIVSQCLEKCVGWTCFGEIDPPCFIAVCTDMRFYRLIDRHLPLIDGTFGIQNLLLLAHTYGIEGTVLNWTRATRRQEKMLRRLLDIRWYEKIIFNIALGYPSKAAPPPGRKAVARTYKLC